MRAHYKRRLGVADDEAPENKDYMSGYKRHQHGKPDPLCERDPAVRIKDMNIEGVDVNLMLPSGWFGAWTTIDDVSSGDGDLRSLPPLDGNLLRSVSQPS